MNLHEKLKAFRKSNGISLRQLSSDTGISNPYLSQLENGRNCNPCVWKLVVLAKYYGTTIDMLISGSNPSDDQSFPLK
jgi:transcriptional regulator with XRE-family HTH domain